MRRFRWGAIAFITLLAAACAPRQLKPVAVIDPAPFLETVNARSAVLEKGLSGTLELAYKNRKQRFKGRVYIVAFPDGRFRLEVPGPLGGTFLVMTSDQREILAFYPGENRAFKSAVNGRAINPYLPFPLPVDPSILPALILGALPGHVTVSGTEAWLMDSGDKILSVASDKSRLRFIYLFEQGQAGRLGKISVSGPDMIMSLSTETEPDYMPKDFELIMPEGTLEGEWDSNAPFSGDEASLAFRIPGSVTVTDLEALP